jgi:hypothetical protein
MVVSGQGKNQASKDNKSIMGVKERTLKKALSNIKNSLLDKTELGSVWNMDKIDVISKIKDLGYDFNYNQGGSTRTLKVKKNAPMIRKKTTIKLGKDF